MKRIISGVAAALLVAGLGFSGIAAAAPMPAGCFSNGCSSGARACLLADKCNSPKCSPNSPIRKRPSCPGGCSK